MDEQSILEHRNHLDQQISSHERALKQLLDELDTLKGDLLLFQDTTAPYNEIKSGHKKLLQEVENLRNHIHTLAIKKDLLSRILSDDSVENF